MNKLDFGAIDLDQLESAPEWADKVDLNQFDDARFTDGLPDATIQSRVEPQAEMTDPFSLFVGTVGQPIYPPMQRRTKEELAKDTAAVAIAEQLNIPVHIARKNLNELQQEVFHRDLTKWDAREKFHNIGMPGSMFALAYFFPFEVAAGIAAYEVTRHAIGFGRTLLTGEPYRPFSLTDYAPEDATQDTLLTLELIELIGVGKLSHPIGGKANSFFTKATRDIIKTSGFPERMFVDPKIFKTDPEFKNNRAEVLSQLGVSYDDYELASRFGVPLEIPTENLVTVADKPYWARLKEKVGVTPYQELQLRTKPEKALKPGKPAKEGEEVLPESEMVPKDQTPALQVVPEQYRDILYQAAADNRIDPDLLARVAYAESRWRSQAVSPKGAEGLMQLMPATAAELGVMDPFDAAQNIRGGAQYLRTLLDRYHGDEVKAVAAYNWGMGNIDKWDGDFAKLPKETQVYVDKIFSDQPMTRREVITQLSRVKDVSAKDKADVIRVWDSLSKAWGDLYRRDPSEWWTESFAGIERMRGDLSDGPVFRETSLDSQLEAMLFQSALPLDPSMEPSNTVTAYKLFRIKDGVLYPLFVDSNTEIPIGQWIRAVAGEMGEEGKVKSKLGLLAYRPGWHSGDYPFAHHIGEGGQPPKYRPRDQVWAEVEISNDVDWQTEANARARLYKKDSKKTGAKAGDIVPSTAHITDQVPYGGHYRYKTNPNMVGNWLISGEMKVNRILSDQEVKAINDEAGYADLPRREPTSTKEFRKWFGRSKVVDRRGNPLVVYHGRKKYGEIPQEFKEKPGDLGPAYFTSDRDVADKYSKGMTPTGEDGAWEVNEGKFGEHVFETYLSIKKPITEDTTLEEVLGSKKEAQERRSQPIDPFHFTASMEGLGDIEFIASDVAAYPKFKEYLAKKGYDGWIYPDQESGGWTYVPFSPTQIKSISNRGTWDPKNPNILYQLNPKEIDGLPSVWRYLLKEERNKLNKSTASRLLELFRSFPSAEEMAAVAWSGRAKRGWYKNSAEAIVDVFGLEDGPRFAALLAALSPQTPVQTNLRNALNMWTNWNRAGRPTDEISIRDLMGKSVDGSGTEKSVMESWVGNTVRALTAEDSTQIKLSGPKVSSFYKNLIGHVNEVTNDSWMANYAMVSQKLFSGKLQKSGDPGKSPGYLAMSAVARKAAKILTERTGETWTPAEVQETVWSWAKTLYEKRKSSTEDRTTKEILKASGLTHEEISGTVDFRSLFVEKMYAKILERGGYGDRLEALRGRSVESLGDVLGTGGPESHEGSGFAKLPYERHLQRAAGRLEKLYKQRLEGSEYLEQPKRGSVEFLEDGRAIIRLFESSDVSTLIHETGHIIRRQLSPEDLSMIEEWAGVEAGTWTRSSEEKFARGFEAYFMEGRAPSSRLRPVFQRMRKMLLQIYRSVKNLEVEINDNVRQVFDRALTTEEERQFNIMAELNDEFKLLPGSEAMDEYDRTMERAERQALRSVEKLRERQRKKQESAWRKEAKSIYDEDPVYQAVDYLRKHPLDLEKLSRDYGEETVKRLSRMKVASKDGKAVHDVVAADLGFTSGDAFINAILDAKSKAVAVEDYVEGMRREASADRSLDFADDHLALLDAQIEAFRLETETSTAKTEGKPAKGLRTFIRQRTGQIKMEDAEGISEYDALKAGIKKAEQASREAWRSGNKEGALAEKIKQRAIAQEYRDRIKARSEVKKIKDQLAKIANKKGLQPEYQDLIYDLLSPWEDKFKTRTKPQDAWTLRGFIEEMIDRGEAAETIPIDEIESVQKKPWKDLTLDDFRLIRDTAKQIAHFARVEKKLLGAFAKQELRAVVNDLADSIAKHAVRVRDTGGVVEFASDMNYWGKFKKGMDSFHWELIKPEFMFRDLDGRQDFGPVWSAIYSKVNEAALKEMEWWKDAHGKLMELFKPFIKDMKRWHREVLPVGGQDSQMAIAHGKRKFVDEKITRARAIMIALNMGNEGNLATLMAKEGYGWTEFQLNTIVGHLTKEEWGLVRGVWDLLESYYPEIAKVHRELTGARLKRVEPRMVQTPYGPIEGGYFPLVWDRDLSSKADRFAAEQDMKDFFNHPYQSKAPASGFTSERKGGKMKANLELGVINRHLKSVIHFNSHAVALRDARKIVMTPEFEASVSATLGKEAWKQMGMWLQDVARPERNPTSNLDKWMNRIRYNSTIVGLGLKISSAIQQPFAVTQAIERLGVGPVLKATGKFWTHPWESVAWVNERSLTMAERYKHWDRDVADLLANPKNPFVGNEKSAQVYFGLMSMMDATASYPAWLAAYDVGFKRFQTEAGAIEYADSIVRQTQTSGLVKDLSRVQRMHGVPRLLTMFYSFMNQVYNMGWEAYRAKVAGGSFLDLAKSAWWILVVPAVIQQAIYDQEAPSPGSAAKAIAQYSIATVPGVRDIVSPWLTGYPYNMTPAAAAMESFVDLGKELGRGDFRARQLFKRGGMAAGYAFGLPSRQIVTTVEGIIDLNEGKTDNPLRLFLAPTEAERKQRR
jgi:hypothetical protein